MDIVLPILEFMVSRCGCDFTADQLTDRVFLCPPSSPQSVTYQVQLHGTLQAPVTDLITLMEEWASSVVTIPVQFLPLIVDGGCASLSSEVECEVIETTQTKEMTSSKVTESTPTEDRTTPVLAGVVVVIVVVIVGIVVVVIVIIITVYVRRAKLQPKDGPE